jgi:hypothetical protein
MAHFIVRNRAAPRAGHIPPEAAEGTLDAAVHDGRRMIASPGKTAWNSAPEVSLLLKHTHWPTSRFGTTKWRMVDGCSRLMERASLSVGVCKIWKKLKISFGPGLKDGANQLIFVSPV